MRKVFKDSGFKIKMTADLLSDTPYEFVKMFKKGKQGLVGLLEHKETNKKYVFKTSQHIDYLCDHEETVARRLNELKCPIFLKLENACTMNVNPDCKADYPFEQCDLPVKKRVLLFSYVRGYSLSKVIKSKPEVSIEAIMSTIKIVLLATYVSHKYVKFTHYDLHTSNILITRCDPDKHILFQIDEGNSFSVPTHGWMPVIIDYGFSYIDTIDDGPMYQSLAHTNVGFISCAPDAFADAKLFLASVSSHTARYRRVKIASKLKKLVRNIFGVLPMDFDCGWDVNNDMSISDKSLACLSKSNTRRSGKVISELFERYDHFAIDLLGSLIILPLNTDTSRKMDTKSMRNTFRIFLKEFSKIEQVVMSSFTRLQILKILVDGARSVMAKYYSGDGDAWKYFKQDVLVGVDTVAYMVDVSHLNFEKMLCALLLFSRELEFYLSDQLGFLLNRKRSEYMNLTVKNVVEIIGAIELKVSADRAISEKSTWSVYNPFKNECEWKPSKENIHSLQKCHALTVGTIISRLKNKTNTCK